VQQTGAFGQGGGLDPAGDGELAQDVADVHAGRGGAQRGRRGRRLPGIQQRLGLPPPRVANPMGATQVRRGRSTGPDRGGTIKA